jgi:hypothetical protein
MTFSQYQQLQGFARKMIADKIAAIQPRAGNLFSVVGDGIAVELPKDSTVEEQAEERWVFVLYGRRRYINIGLGEYDNEWSDWYAAAWAPRKGSGLLLISGLFWQETSFFNIFLDDEGSESFGRSVEVDFQIRTADGRKGWPSFEDAEYRSPIELTLEEYSQLNGIFIETIETYKIKLRRSGHQQTFKPETPNTFYELRPTAFTRL